MDELEYQKRNLKAMSYLAFRFPHKYFLEKRIVYNKQEFVLFENVPDSYYGSYSYPIKAITLTPENKIDWKWKKNAS